MKRHLVFLFTALLFVHTALLKAQHPNSIYATSGYVSLNIGDALPIGKFAEEKHSDYGGYALNGMVRGIAAGIPIHHSNFGVAITYSNIINMFDQEMYANNYQASGITKPISSNRTASDSYVSNIILAGVYYTTALRNFSFDIRIEGGINFCALPEAHVSYEVYPFNKPPPESIIVGTDPSYGSGFAFSTDITERYAFIKNKIGFMLKEGFLYSNVHYKTTYENPTPPDYNTTQIPISGNIPILIASLQAGVFYQFGK